MSDPAPVAHHQAYTLRGKGASPKRARDEDFFCELLRTPFGQSSQKTLLGTSVNKLQAPRSLRPQRSLSLLSWNLSRSCSKASGWIRTSPLKG